MAIAVDIKDGRGSCSKTHRQLQDYGNTLLAFSIAAKYILCAVYC